MEPPFNNIDGLTMFTEIKDFIRLSNLNQEIWNRLTKIKENAQKADCSQEELTLRLIDTYPNVAQFKTSLVRNYLRNNKMQQARTWTKKIAKEHSNYFFGKVDLACYYVEQNDFEGATAILGGGDLLLKNLIPNRTEYMKIEFLEFYRIAILVHLEKGEEFQVLSKLSKMMKIDKEHNCTKFITDNIEIDLKYKINLN